MTKLKYFLDFEKEEKWLERMALHGWQLKENRVFYWFESAPPQKANIKIDYRIFKKQEDFAEYLALFEDSGWKHIAGTKSSGNQYFMRIGENSSEDIFSDAASRAGRYKRLSNALLSGFIAILPLFVIAASSGLLNMEGFLNPKMFYYTPGLWDMNGGEFWRKFLFETPFALLRGYAWVAWVAVLLASVFYIVKSHILYKKALSMDSDL